MKQWLIDQENGQKVVVISGTSGIGKSALACEFALQNQEKFFPDGIYGVRVNEKRYTNNEDFLETIARDLLSQQGIRLDEDEIRNGQPIIRKMKDEFAKIQALIIFDNVETMTINRLFPSGKCSIIVTTINHRFFQASSQYKYIELLLPNQVESQENERLVNESLKLLKKLVGENRRQEINQNESIAREILNLMAYLPLAVKIISISLEGTFENDSLNDFLNSLRNERSRLVHCKPEREQRNLDVWYSFALAFQGLSEEIEKEIFFRLGACAQTRFSIRLISAITGFELKDARTYLKRLETKYFVKEIKVNENESYFVPIHNLIHDFARFLLERKIVFNNIKIPDDLEKTAKDNHAQYFVDLVAQINNQATYYCRDFFAKLNQDFDNFYLAIKYLAESREESTFPNFKGMLDNGMLGEKVPEFFIQYGYGSQFVELSDLCIGRIHTINSENDGSLFIYQIKLLFKKNRFLIGLNRLREAEDLLKDLSGKVDQLNYPILKDDFNAEWSRLNGRLRQKEKKFQEAESFFKECIDIL